MEDMKNKHDAVTKNAAPESVTHVPVCDVIEQPRGIKIVMEMPGVAAEDLNIDVKDRILKVCSESHFAWNGRTVRYCRSFQLSDDIDCTGISAKVKNGVLELKMPKSESATVHKVKVETA